MTIARYSITTGLAGCYLPNGGPYLMTARTRGELADSIREEITGQGFPKATFAQANIKELWGRIKRHGSSCQHFSIEHGAYEIAFHGLTEEEADNMLEEELGE